MPRAVESRVGHAWEDIQSCGRSDRRKIYRAVFGVPERKIPLGKPQLKCDDVIKVNLQDIRLEVMSQNTDQVGIL